MIVVGSGPERIDVSVQVERQERTDIPTQDSRGWGCCQALNSLDKDILQGKRFFLLSIWSQMLILPRKIHTGTGRIVFGHILRHHIAAQSNDIKLTIISLLISSRIVLFFTASNLNWIQPLDFSFCLNLLYFIECLSFSYNLKILVYSYYFILLFHKG